MRSRARALLRDQRGAALVETLVAFPTLLFTFLGLYMLTFIFTGHLIVMRAADAAARAAIVMLQEDPVRFDASFSAEDHIRLAAHIVLASSAHLSLADVSWNQPARHEPLTAQVHATFHCSAFLAAFMCGPGRAVSIRAQATLPLQGYRPDR